ncbi:hypothetical protein EW146_g4860 [Bondarzewia mesenterica]|uniref:Proteophosphoglycan ppg4 n=1 Tax=Bondarzewia mesenterica TaxID=1095465 RepID=A0A4S4LTA2_9AGAM|nr:hypothetical protein EW146_g4860 [Bondarzewia mesenterica]
MALRSRRGTGGGGGVQPPGGLRRRKAEDDFPMLSTNCGLIISAGDDAHAQHVPLRLLLPTISPRSFANPPRGITADYFQGRHHLLFFLFFVLGGSSIMFASRPFTQWSLDIFNTRVEIKSFFLATVLFIVLLILAYLTNPSETSFRSYLTEQCFRHHLSRLDDASDDDHSDSEDSGVHYSSRRSTPSSCRSDLLESGSSFHFSNRASVALRTPKHSFHSFGFFTIAAVIPNPKSPSRTSSSGTGSGRSAHGNRDPDGSPSRESWFIGAFGRWWRGIEIPWPQRSPARSKCEEEGWSSGILNVKALDKMEEYNGLPFPTTSPRSAQRSPPKLRSRDRSNPRHNQPRTSSPPPLPKSATLPLHTPRHPQPVTAPTPKTGSQSHAHSVQPSPPRPPSVTHSRTPSSTTLVNHIPSFESTPAIAELLRQISHTRSVNHDLRLQVSEHTSSSSTADAALAEELAAARDAKHAEDVGRGELKARTKVLEDNRRTAEAGKREAERRLRVAQGAQEEAGARIEKLAEEIRLLEEQIRNDSGAVKESRAAAEREEAALKEKLEKRRKEVHVAEEVVSALGVRARELEEAIEREREALKMTKDKAEMLRQDRSFLSLTVVKNQDNWEPIASESSPKEAMSIAEFEDVFPTPLEKDHDSSGSVSARSRSRGVSASPRPRPLNLIPISNLAYNPSASNPEPLASRTKAYSIFDTELASVTPHTTTFSPFGDADDEKVDDNDSSNSVTVPRTAPLNIAGAHAFSSSTTSLIPNSLIPSLESPSSLTGPNAVSKSFQSENDVFLDRDWRRRLPRHSDSSAISIGSHVTPSGPLNTSPISTNAPSTFPTMGGVDGQADYDPFEVRPPPPAHHLYQLPRQRLISDPLDLQRAWPVRTNSDPSSHESSFGNGIGKDTHTRRWWSAEKEKDKKGLNPDAKVFRISRKPAFTPPVPVPHHQPYDTLNPSAPPGSTPFHPPSPTASAAPALFSGLAMRAFAPVAPRSARRCSVRSAGSTNTSLERLPSLSEVGSGPVSPAHVHAHHHGQAGGLPLDLGAGKRSWLLSLAAPKGGKMKFSPWGEGEEGGGAA